MSPGSQKGSGEGPREEGADRFEERVEELHNQADSKKIPKFDPKERARLSGKRPWAGLPLVEDVTTAELANLIQEAVKMALKEKKRAGKATKGISRASKPNNRTRRDPGPKQPRRRYPAVREEEIQPSNPTLTFNRNATLNMGPTS
ncbi:hypothetical protein EX30DRAFT_371475 [Ascodesmis nigricans]|uniref:Uncharacterized protein n=1 Tax=Ascodesmis nigricans TaxID=341454 RepID=A0A4S2MY07_9PEZI|nr:hypothetical protein EX30DRAFT_371475 [Ascodesmis nigricans]